MITTSTYEQKPICGPYIFVASVVIAKTKDTDQGTMCSHFSMAFILRSDQLYFNRRRKCVVNEQLYNGLPKPPIPPRKEVISHVNRLPAAQIQDSFGMAQEPINHMKKEDSISIADNPTMMRW